MEWAGVTTTTRASLHCSHPSTMAYLYVINQLQPTVVRVTLKQPRWLGFCEFGPLLADLVNLITRVAGAEDSVFPPPAMRPAVGQPFGSSWRPSDEDVIKTITHPGGAVRGEDRFHFGVSPSLSGVVCVRNRSSQCPQRWRPFVLWLNFYFLHERVG